MLMTHTDTLPALSRRSALALLAAGAVSGAMTRRGRAAAVEGLEILLAPTGASICLARAVDSGALGASLPGATIRPWREPDELRAGIVSGRTLLFSTPTHVPANLANRGMPLRLACLLGMGHLYVVTSDEGVSSFKDLAGTPVLGFFRNDMPDLVFRACARMEGLDPDKDFQLTYVQGGMEAAQMLAAGKAGTAILSEPPATAAMMMAAQQGKTLRRAISLQEVWSRHKGTKGIPMVGVAVHEKLLEQAPELAGTLRTSLPAAREWALANRPESAALAEKVLQFRAPVFEKAIERFNMQVIPAREARPALEGFYQTLLDFDPAALGGNLPPAAFYLDL
jgi:NitT/TauT family transport system substrate-binding protein